MSDEIAERAQWSSKADGLLSLIGYAVDLGNVWRFPYICYRNGGGAFLIPYLICFIFGGLPMFYLELLIGQYFQNGCISVWDKIVPALKGVGITVICVNFFVSWYYNVVIGLSMYYFVSSFTLSADSLPWASCDNEWNTVNCFPQKHKEFSDGFTSTDLLTNYTETAAQQFLNIKVLKIDNSSGFGDFGGLEWILICCVATVFAIIYLGISRGVKSSGKIVWFTAIAPYVLLTCLLIRGITLPGAMEGIKFYLLPDPEKLLDTSVWKDAGQQILFSLGTGFGVLMAFSSYNKKTNNVQRDAIVSGCINCATSVLAGFVVFSVIGYLAHTTNKPISSVVQEGPALVFEVYPAALAQMPFSNIWAIMFFFMLITLGLDSSFGGLESIVTAITDQFPRQLSSRRKTVTFVAVFICFIGSLPSLTYGGQFWIGMLDYHACTNSLTVIVLLEMFSFVYGFGFKNLMRINREMLQFEPNWYWKACWLYSGPLFLLVLVTFSLLDSALLSSIDPEVFPVSADITGFSLMAFSVSFIPIYALYYFCAQKRDS